jgi:hypothetical protein
MADEQDRAEALDEDTHDTDFPPEEPMGVDDPTQDDRVEDSVESREARRDTEPDRERRSVVQPYVDEDEAVLDDEAELIGEAIVDERDADADSAPAAAEEAAVHLED